MLKFKVVESINEILEEGVYLIADNWDDWFEFEIAYTVWLYNVKKICLGRVKIAEKMQNTRKCTIPQEFFQLEDKYFSIGFDADYYDNVKDTSYREEIHKALNDIAFNLDLYEEVRDYRVTIVSLLREYSELTLRGQLNRIAHGGAKLSNYDFTYIFPSINPISGEKVELTFKVERKKKPLSNIHVLIGKNGIGKTTILKKIIYALEKCKSKEEVGEVNTGWGTDFANIVFVSFSAFDNPIFEENFSIPYKFVGLVKQGSIKSTTTLTEEFVECSFGFYKNSAKMNLWQDSIKILESDKTFVDQEISGWISNDIKNELLLELERKEYYERILNTDEKGNWLKERHKERVFNKFAQLSSGHKIILLTIVNLIDLVEEKTIVLMDEPEEHLHPPLVAAFIKTLSNLLTFRNGVGIVATHSPVIVQEVPKKCVWVLERKDRYVIPRRPEIETFGENLGELTSEIFRYEVVNSGFHKELMDAVEESDSYEEAKSRFNDELGKEAKSILRAYMYDKEKNLG